MFRVPVVAEIKELRGAFAVPVRSRLRLKSLQIPARRFCAPRSVAEDSFAVWRLFRQQAEQWKVILAAKEDNLLVGSVRQHAEIEASVNFFAPPILNLSISMIE
jgi:hypothetical protein